LKTRDALDGLAEKIHHYSGLVEVFVSHHPEYTALVWGAIKFLFVVSPWLHSRLTWNRSADIGG
jgi:hypothetical protein